MKNNTTNTPPNRFSNQLRSSIVWKLNAKLFFRTLGLFWGLNIILLAASVAGLFWHTEQIIADVTETLVQSGMPSAEAKDWLALNGYSISLQAGEAKGFHMPENLQKYLSPQTATAARSFDLPEPKILALGELLREFTYNVTVETDDITYLISYHPQRILNIFIQIFAIILLLQLVKLLSSIFSGARLIRKTLRPIQDLAETAQTLSNQDIFSPEQLKDLAGKLDHINAARLDTRISVGETQSELKSLASAINGMLDRINASYRSQVRFVSDASHELRTPISVIQGYANLLDRWGKKDEKTLQESIDAIKDETANMKALVEQLLFLARGDNNTMVLQVEQFDLAHLADEVSQQTQMIDTGHDYNLCVSPVYINADKNFIKQAARILVDNAMKYTPSGKRITISVSDAAGYARLTVQDEGIGIAPEAVPRVFDRFFRTDESRARATGGAGLGLSIAKWITERHGGHMEVLSRLNIGTRISIVLPIASGPPLPNIPENETTPP